MRCGSGRRQRGQALVETTIVISIFVFVILGALQIMMIQHGRIMTEYAAYNAARAGVVHNANWNVMRNAALIGALPLYRRTDTPGEFLRTWATVKVAAELTEAIDTAGATLERLAGDLIGVPISGIVQDISLIEVHVTSPDAQAFRAAEQFMRREESRAQQADARFSGERGLRFPEGYEEIDFDLVEFLREHPEGGRLGIEVRVLYPLKIPIINKIIFELWLAQLLLQTRRVESDITEWAELRGRTVGGRHSGRYLDEAVAEAEGEGPTDDFFTTRQWVKEVRTLRYVAENYGVYLIPLHATYAMQMQSNMFEENQREPVWFSLGD